GEIGVPQDVAAPDAEKLAVLEASERVPAALGAIEGLRALLEIGGELVPQPLPHGARLQEPREQGRAPPQPIREELAPAAPPSRATRCSAPGWPARSRKSAGRSPWAARRSRLLSAMSGSGASAISWRRRGRNGASSSASRGSGVIACRLASARAGSLKPRRLR